MPPRALPWFAASFLVLPSLASAQVGWRTDAPETALSEARRDHRRTLVDFAAAWCGPCRQMDATVWNREDVSLALASGWLPLRVDVDTPEGGALRQRFGVTSLPTVLALGDDGAELGRLTGASDAALVLASVAAWTRGEGVLQALLSRLETSPDDLALRLDVGGRYVEAGDVANATLHLERVVALDPDNARGAAARALHLLGVRLHLERQNPAGAVPYLQELLRRCAGTFYADRGHVSLALALHRAGRDDEARATLGAFLERVTDNVAAERATEVALAQLEERWDLPSAERLARERLARFASHAPLQDALARVVFAQGRSAEAAELERVATELDPANALYRERLAAFSGAPPPSEPVANTAPRAGEPVANTAPRPRRPRRPRR